MKSVISAVARTLPTLLSRAPFTARTRRQRFNELRRFSQSIIEDAPFSIIALNAAGTITAMNNAAQALTLYRSEELVGKQILALHDPNEVSICAETLTRELGQPVAAGFGTLVAALGRRRSHEADWNYMRRDGSRVAVHMTLTKLRNARSQVTGYLAIAFDVSERKALIGSISFLASHDSLTKFPNLSRLAELAQTAIDEAPYLYRRVAVFVIDIDHFKRINDSLGHGIGDMLLMQVGQFLKQSVRTQDIVVRISGDEFIVMMPDAGEISDIKSCGSRLVEAMRRPFEVAGQLVTLTASIGVCTFPELGQDFESLLRNAETAMYSAKCSGRNCFRSFSETMLKARVNRLELEADLCFAIEQEQFTLHYQAQFDAKKNELTGVEALLRWNHPTRGNVPPTDFIQAAEECGMIVPIGEWVLHRACEEARKTQIETNRHFTIAVNLSPRQVLQDNLFEVVESALQGSGLAAEDLELEITENTLMIASDETTATLVRIRNLGVKLAIDDFGTGFSSFQYILDHKVDRLKIDRSFIAKCAFDATSTAVVRTVIAMAHGLNMSVVAEGVETSEQLAFLLHRRCDFVQGYLFGHPEPLRDLVMRPISSPHVAIAKASQQSSSARLSQMR